MNKEKRLENNPEIFNWGQPELINKRNQGN